jgi:hypothetical protein
MDLGLITRLRRLGGRVQSGCISSRSVLAPERDAVRVADVRDALSRAGSARDGS